ncbi:MAG: hydrolase [Acidimicrobiaceae bacterium]|nr:hydrolase [Acidimicrobiaceae bacterium]|tara:strand:+ start:1025 stop:2272 length:1248 start_codon:yes stop_codon:yes gene_type:complete
MSNSTDTSICIQNAYIPGRGLSDLTIEQGKITAFTQPIEAQANNEVHDLKGWLLVPAMAEPHAHLDKALTADIVPNPSGELMGAIKAWIEAAEKGTFTHENTVQRACEAMELLVTHGITAVRTHVNVTSDIGTSSVEALAEAKKLFTDVLDVQIVALMNSPMTGPNSKGNVAALHSVIEFGVDFVGGCPHLEPNPEEMIAFILELSRDAGLGIDFHVDETLDGEMLTLIDLAKQVINTGFPHPVSASHCVSLGMQSEKIQSEVSKLVAEANISVFALPQTNLYLQGREHQKAMPRGLTAVKALTENGVLVAAGADNVRDPFNLMGRSDPLETASLMVMAGHQSIENAFQMVSANARKAMGLESACLNQGDLADFVAIDASSLGAAMADAPMNRRVFKAGKLVASVDQTSAIYKRL